MAKRHSCNHNSSSSSSSTKLMDVDRDVVVKILARLPVESVCCVRCVSKSILDMVDDGPIFSKLHTLSLTDDGVTDRVPQLMFYSPYKIFNAQKHITEFYSLKYDGSSTLTKGKHALQIFSSKLRDQSHYRVDCVFCDLFFIRDIKFGRCFLVNPLRGEVLRLPTSDFTIPASRLDSFKYCYGMGFDSITHTYKIVRVQYNGKSDDTAQLSLVTQVLVLGTSSWREIPSVPAFSLNAKRNVCAYGDMHWLIVRQLEKICTIISFDFKKEKFYSTPYPGCVRWGAPDLNIHLVTLRGSLATVDSTLSTNVTMNIRIWVLKDYHKREWRQDYNIDIELLGVSSDFMTKGIMCGEWEHGIFFSNEETQKPHPPVFVDLKRGSFTIVNFRHLQGCHNRIFSYTKSLISLKDYRHSLEAEAHTGSLKSYCKLIEGEAEGFSLSENHTLRKITC